MKHFRCWLLLFAMSLPIGFVQPAAAAIITVDQDSFADDTIIANAFSGVTLTEAGISPGAPVYANANTLNSTAPNVFGRAFGGNVFSNWIFGQREFRASFAVDTDFVSLDFVKPHSSGVATTGELRAYSSGGSLLQFVTTDFGGASSSAGTVDVLSISRGSADIAYILAGGPGSFSVNVDRLRYAGDAAAVPEPSGCAALCLLAMAAGTVRRQRKLPKNQSDSNPV